LQDWIETILRFGAGRSDAILLRHACRAADDDATLAEINELALAMAPSRERRAEASGQGNAFAAAARHWDAGVLQLLEGDIAYCVAVGAMAGANGIDENMVCAGLLQAFAANLISAAVRLVPLGQSDGLAVLAALEPAIATVERETRRATLDDLGGACFRCDIAAMKHETQYTRLFRT
jgi:urease accessory protein